MAIAVDLSGNSPIGPVQTDSRLSKAQSSGVAGTPIGTRTPNFPGEVIRDSTNRVLYRATGPANTNWQTTRDRI